MHIPDGYLSPSTCAVMGAAMVPVWAVAGRRVKRVVRSRYVPLIALAAAYAFLVMMFNIPIPDGTTAHAVGAVLIAVILGPWAATIAVCISLLIQALFFGDGGVLAYGANAFNMAFVMPFVGYGVYRAVSRGSALTSRRRALAAGIGGYAGINAAAFCAAVEFGLQPVLFSSPDGTPLYAPFGLGVTIPAMALAHLTVAGGVEAVLTFGAVAYLQRANLPLLRINHAAAPATDARLPAPARLGWSWALLPLGAMLVLTPLGLLATGGAFGEDAPSDLDVSKYGLTGVPAGLHRDAGSWSHAVLGGYGFSDGRHEVGGYLLSAGVGVAAVAAAVAGGFALVRAVSRARRSSAGVDSPAA